MYHEYKGQPLESNLRLTDRISLVTINNRVPKDNLIHIYWNRTDHSQVISVDGIVVELAPNQLTTSTYLQNVKIEQEIDLTVFSFNREFYCIQDHDEEVSCNGIIFFGAQDIPILTLDEEEQTKMDVLLDVFIDEFETKDNIQGEMLQMLLKRLIIKCTRMARKQLIPKRLDKSQVDIIRKFNVLVDQNYKTLKQVSDYADLLFKSPKTLSNLFKIYGEKSPLRIIHERIVLEGKRLLSMTDKTSKEIAYDLGFDDVSSFGKMFKKITGQTPVEYKKSLRV